MFGGRKAERGFETEIKWRLTLMDKNSTALAVTRNQFIFRVLFVLQTNTAICRHLLMKSLKSDLYLLEFRDARTSRSSTDGASSIGELICKVRRRNGIIAAHILRNASPKVVSSIPAPLGFGDL